MDLRDDPTAVAPAAISDRAPPPQSKRKRSKTGSITTRPNLKTPKQITYLQRVLNDHELLKNIDDATRDKMIENMWRREIANETRLINEGDQGVHFYIIEKGEFEVYRKQESGYEVMVNCLGAGASFGELSFISNAPRKASVVASEDSIVWVLDRETWDIANELASTSPDTQRKKNASPKLSRPTAEDVFQEEKNIILKFG
jgi:signal-transduction protein with cAMP-binding, CBS, and nucleotidyltransferase domain